MNGASRSLTDPAVRLARQSLYRFAALTFLDPRAGSWELLWRLREDGLLIKAAELVRGLPALRRLACAPGELPVSHLDPARVLEKLPRTADELNRDYEQTFGLLVAGGCPAYETEYIHGRESFQRSNALADVSGFYRAFGLELAPQRRERPDHIVLELEFMAFLAGLEHRAPSEEQGRLCRAAQARFLREHLAWWAPAFGTLLGRETGSGFYGRAAEHLRAWIPVERRLLGVAAATRIARPSPIEPPEACEGCQLKA